MSGWSGTALSWLAEVYLLSTVILAAAILGMRASRQPARRLAVARSALLALALVAPLVAGARAIRLIRDNARAKAAAMVPAGSAAVALLCCPEPSLPAPAVPNPLGPATAAALAFAAGSCGMVAWLALGAIASVRLGASLRPAPDRLGTMLDRVVGGGRRRPRLVVSARVVHPVAAGLVRPSIVIPPHFAETEPADRIEAALAHEWTHVANGDLWMLTLGRILLPLLFAHPLYAWLRLRMQADQEALADAAAAGSDGRIAYAEALLAWSLKGRSHPRKILAPGLGLWGRTSMLTGRVALLLDRDFRVEPICPRLWRLAVRGITAALIAGLALASLTGAAESNLAPPSDAAAAVPHVHAKPTASLSGQDACPPAAVACCNR